MKITNYSDNIRCSGAVLSAERRRWGHRRYKKAVTIICKPQQSDLGSQKAAGKTQNVLPTGLNCQYNQG